MTKKTRNHVTGAHLRKSRQHNRQGVPRKRSFWSAQKATWEEAIEALRAGGIAEDRLALGELDYRDLADGPRKNDWLMVDFIRGETARFVRGRQTIRSGRAGDASEQRTQIKSLERAASQMKDAARKLRPRQASNALLMAIGRMERTSPDYPRFSRDPASAIADFCDYVEALAREAARLSTEIPIATGRNSLTGFDDLAVSLARAFHHFGGRLEISPGADRDSFRGPFLEFFRSLRKAIERIDPQAFVPDQGKEVLNDSEIARRLYDGSARRAIGAALARDWAPESAPAPPEGIGDAPPEG